MARNLRRTLPCAALALLALAPAAQASSLTIDSVSATLQYTGGAYEENRLEITYSQLTGSYTITDVVPMTVSGSGSGGCTAPGTTVTCPGAGLIRHVINLADSEDSAVVSGPLPATIDGGHSSDSIQGGDGDDTLIGNNGSDSMAGGGGNDTFNGGNGKDRVDYSAAPGAVTVTQDGAPGDGPAGESDNVPADIEVLIGSPAGDSLAAGPPGSTLQGGEGADTLTGGIGSDQLDGGAGVDTFASGGGDDTIASADGEVEDVDCGADVDTVVNDLSDRIAASCETYAGKPDPAPGTDPTPETDRNATGALDIVMPVRPVTLGAPGVLKVALGCAATAASDCRGEIYVELPARHFVRAKGTVTGARGRHAARQRRIGRKKFLVQRGKSVTARVPLVMRGHYVMRNRGRRRIRGRIVVVQRDVAGKELGRTTRPVVLERKWARKGIKRRR